MTDAELVQRAQDGEADAYADLVKRYQALAHRTAYLITGGSEEAEDAAQSGIIKAFYAIDRFQMDSPFRPWLLKIVANEARNRRRSAQRRAALTLRLVDDSSERSVPSPEFDAFTQDQRKALLRAVNNLREGDRLVIAYRYFLDLSEAETAEIMGCAVGTVKSRLSRALSRLRAALVVGDELLGVAAARE